MLCCCLQVWHRLWPLFRAGWWTSEILGLIWGSSHSLFYGPPTALGTVYNNAYNETLKQRLVKIRVCSFICYLMFNLSWTCWGYSVRWSLVEKVIVFSPLARRKWIIPSPPNHNLKIILNSHHTLVGAFLFLQRDDSLLHVFRISKRQHKVPQTGSKHYESITSILLKPSAPGTR